MPESQEFKNVRKEMVRYSNKSAKRVGHKARLHESKRRQIRSVVIKVIAKLIVYISGTTWS